MSRWRLGQHEPLAGPNLMTRKLDEARKLWNYSGPQAAEAVATRRHVDELTIRRVTTARKEVDDDAHGLGSNTVDIPHIDGDDNADDQKDTKQEKVKKKSAIVLRHEPRRNQETEEKKMQLRELVMCSARNWRFASANHVSLSAG